MKILFAVVLLYSSLKAIGQQTVGQLFENMNLLPWVAINSATSGQNGNSASTAFGFDLNKDGSDDISLSIQSSSSGWASSATIRLYTFNGYKVWMDTNYVENFQFLTNQYDIIDSSRLSTVAKKFSENDTLDSAVSKSTDAVIVKYYRSTYPALTSSNVNPFVGGTGYLVLENEMGVITILKILQNSISNISILETRTSETLNYFKPVFCYPNPSSDFVKFVGAIEKIYAYSLDGKLIYETQEPQINPEINLEDLPAGIYLFSCLIESQWQSMKIVKTAGN